jgi:NAD(P)H-dependent FMN reductase
MPHIAIISSSVRTGRQSHRVALYFKNYLETNDIATAEILDLKEYKFPLFEERLKYQKNPAPITLEFAAKIKSADGIIIVTPEYNGGYPPSLKNIIDLLYDEWHRKPVAISTVSDGSFGGTQVITSLQFSLWKIRAWTVPAMFPYRKSRILLLKMEPRKKKHQPINVQQILSMNCFGVSKQKRECLNNENLNLPS